MQRLDRLKKSTCYYKFHIYLDTIEQNIETNIHQHDYQTIDYAIGTRPLSWTKKEPARTNYGLKSVSLAN